MWYEEIGCYNLKAWKSKRVGWFQMRSDSGKSRNSCFVNCCVLAFSDVKGNAHVHYLRKTNYQSSELFSGIISGWSSDFSFSPCIKARSTTYWPNLIRVLITYGNWWCLTESAIITFTFHPEARGRSIKEILHYCVNHEQDHASNPKNSETSGASVILKEYASEKASNSNS